MVGKKDKSCLRSRGELFLHEENGVKNRKQRKRVSNSYNEKKGSAENGRDKQRKKRADKEIMV